MIVAIVAVVIAVKVLVWDAEVVNMTVVVEALAIDMRAGVVSNAFTDFLSEMLTGVDIIASAAVVIVFDFAVTISYPANVLSNVVTDVLINALADALIRFLTIIDVEVLADVKANVFAITALEFAVSMSLEEFDC